MIHCIAIDDEPLALVQISGYIRKVPFLKLVHACSNAFEAMEVLAKNNIDLVFIDIHMPDLNGMDFIKSLTKRPMVIFTTAYPEYALESFRVDALDYLLKPFGFNDFLKASNKAFRQSELMEKHTASPSEITPTPPQIPSSAENNYLFIKADYKIIRIDINTILYIESQNEYVRIFTDDTKPVVTLLSMKALEERLPPSRFMRVHRSYIVNLQKIPAIANNRIIFGKETYIPVSNLYKEKFNNYMEKHFLGKM